jgi:uncharacterized membrane protein YgaE (UPF0421/DUF939 family)
MGELRWLGLHESLLIGVAARISYELPHALGLPEAFWGAITAIAVIHGELGATRGVARIQFTGAAIGGAAGLVMTLLLGHAALVFGLAIFLSTVTCVALKAANAGRMAGITCSIIMLVPPIGSPERMFAARLVEVGWGILVAVVLVWAAGRLSAASLP